MYDTHARKHRALGTGRAALVTTVLALFIAVPALADHPLFYGRNSCGRSGRVDGYVGGARFGHAPKRADVGRSELEYERGYQRGHRRGSEVGYRHGFNGRAFRGMPARDLSCQPRFFIKGYLEAYGRAYTQGFRRGRADCGTTAHHRRHR